MDSLDFLNSDFALKGEFLGLLFSLLSAGVLALFRPRVRLIFGRANNSLNHVSVPDPSDAEQSNTFEIYAEKFFLQNTGKKPATDVEFVLSSWPTDINVWQPRSSEFLQVGKGLCMIAIPRIAPGELVILDCVYVNQTAARIESVKCGEALGKEVPFQTVRRFSRSVELAFLGSLLLGLAFLIQVVLTLMGVLS